MRPQYAQPYDPDTDPWHEDDEQELAAYGAPMMGGHMGGVPQMPPMGWDQQSAVSSQIPGMRPAPGQWGQVQPQPYPQPFPNGAQGMAPTAAPPNYQPAPYQGAPGQAPMGCPQYQHPCGQPGSAANGQQHYQQPAAAQQQYQQQHQQQPCAQPGAAPPGYPAYPQQTAAQQPQQPYLQQPCTHPGPPPQGQQQYQQQPCAAQPGLAPMPAQQQFQQPCNTMTGMAPMGGQPQPQYQPAQQPGFNYSASMYQQPSPETDAWDCESPRPSMSQPGAIGSQPPFQQPAHQSPYQQQPYAQPGTVPNGFQSNPPPTAACAQQGTPNAQQPFSQPPTAQQPCAQPGAGPNAQPYSQPPAAQQPFQQQPCAQPGAGPNAQQPYSQPPAAQQPFQQQPCAQPGAGPNAQQPYSQPSAAQQPFQQQPCAQPGAGPNAQQPYQQPATAQQPFQQQQQCAQPGSAASAAQPFQQPCQPPPPVAKPSSRRDSLGSRDCREGIESVTHIANWGPASQDRSNGMAPLPGQGPQVQQEFSQPREARTPERQQVPADSDEYTDTDEDLPPNRRLRLVDVVLCRDMMKNPLPPWGFNLKTMVWHCKKPVPGMYVWRIDPGGIVDQYNAMIRLTAESMRNPDLLQWQLRIYDELLMINGKPYRVRERKENMDYLHTASELHLIFLRPTAAEREEIRAKAKVASDTESTPALNL